MRKAEVFGQQLTAAMGSMSLAELARRANLSRQQVHRYLNGAALPRADAFMKLCDVLDIDPRVAMPPDGVARKRVPRTLESEMFGNAADPSTAQFPSGIYEFYSANPVVMGQVTRLVLVITNDGQSCRVRTIAPPDVVPSGTPIEFRQMYGAVKVKFEQTYILTLQSGQRAGTNERLVLTVLLGLEDPSRPLRLGIISRSIPSPRAPFIASKVALRRLEKLTYRQARKRQSMLDIDQLPPEISEYFLAPSSHPYHFGPSVDLLSEATRREASRITASLEAAAQSNDDLSVAFGGLRIPTEHELQSGIYELYTAIDVNSGLMRLPMLIEGEQTEGRWLFCRVPNRLYHHPLPREIREMTGQVMVKHNHILHLFGQIRSHASDQKVSHYFRFGLTDFRTGIRLGFVTMPDVSVQAPLVSRAALIRSTEQNFRKAYAQATNLHVEDAPIGIQNYFTKVEDAPYVMSTSSHPKLL